MVLQMGTRYYHSVNRIDNRSCKPVKKDPSMRGVFYYLYNMNPTDPITAQVLMQLGFIRRPDWIGEFVDDCWSFQNLIVYQTFAPMWHVQVGFFLTSAVRLQAPINTLGDLQRVFRDANGQNLNLA